MHEEHGQPLTYKITRVRTYNDEQIITDEVEIITSRGIRFCFPTFDIPSLIKNIREKAENENWPINLR
jgi:hypothetical protein